MAGDKALVNPEVTPVALSDGLEQKYLQVFSVCTVTHVMSERQKEDLADEEGEVELAYGFMA